MNRRLGSLDTFLKRRGDQNCSNLSKKSLDDQVFLNEFKIRNGLKIKNLRTVFMNWFEEKLGSSKTRIALDKFEFEGSRFRKSYNLKEKVI